MTIRPVTDADLPRILELTDAEGWGYELPDLWRLLTLCGPGFLCAVDETGSVVATLSCLPYAGAAWIGNVVVDGSARGRGIGRLLMDAAHAFCDGRHLAHVYLDAFPPAIGFYRGLGYHDDGETHRWSLTVAHGQAVSRPGTYVLEPRELEDLTAADADVLDHNGMTHRRALLSHLMRDYPGWALGVRDAAGGLDAWGLARPGSTSSELGPIGGSPEAAALLGDALLSRLEGRVVELSTPAANGHGERWLLAHGFERIGWHLRMYRGARLHWNRDRTWALGGLEKG